MKKASNLEVSVEISAISQQIITREQDRFIYPEMLFPIPDK